MSMKMQIKFSKLGFNVLFNLLLNPEPIDLLPRLKCLSTDPEQRVYLPACLLS